MTRNDHTQRAAGKRTTVDDDVDDDGADADGAGADVRTAVRRAGLAVDPAWRASLLASLTAESHDHDAGTVPLLAIDQAPRRPWYLAVAAVSLLAIGAVVLVAVRAADDTVAPGSTADAPADGTALPTSPTTDNESDNGGDNGGDNGDVDVSALVGRTWVALEVDSHTLPTLLFDSLNTAPGGLALNGTDGCNTFGSKFSLSPGGVIDLEPRGVDWSGVSCPTVETTPPLVDGMLIELDGDTVRVGSTTYVAFDSLAIPDAIPPGTWTAGFLTVTTSDGAIEWGDCEMAIKYGLGVAEVIAGCDETRAFHVRQLDSGELLVIPIGSAGSVEPHVYRLTPSTTATFVDSIEDRAWVLLDGSPEYTFALRPWLLLTDAAPVLRFYNGCQWQSADASLAVQTARVEIVAISASAQTDNACVDGRGAPLPAIGATLELDPTGRLVITAPDGSVQRYASIQNDLELAAPDTIAQIEGSWTLDATSVAPVQFGADGTIRWGTCAGTVSLVAPGAVEVDAVLRSQVYASCLPEGAVDETSSRFAELLAESEQLVVRRHHSTLLLTSASPDDAFAFLLTLSG